MSRVLAIGDIHTKTWVIEEAQKIIDNYDAIIFCGDYADDWGATPQDSIMTWNMLKTLQENYPEKVKLVIGNHDYIYVNYTKTIASGYNQITQLLIDMPENSLIQKWLKAMPVTLAFDGVTYSHAGLTVSYTGGHDLWDDDSPLWARPGGEDYQDIPQVFGHTPSETCWEVQPNVWCIDTFSTYPNGDQFGDNTALEVIDGKAFNKIKLGEEKL